MNQSKMWLYFILLLVGGRPSWNLYQSCHKMYGAFSDWFLHIASWMEGHWLYLWLEERAVKRRKRGAERLEGRKFKKSEIKRYFYLFGEKAASQTEGEPEERKKHTHTHIRFKTSCDIVIRTNNLHINHQTACTKRWLMCCFILTAEPLSPSLF